MEGIFDLNPKDEEVFARSQGEAVKGVYSRQRADLEAGTQSSTALHVAQNSWRGCMRVDEKRAGDKQGPLMKATGCQTEEPGLYLVGQSFLNCITWNIRGLFKKDW